MAGNEDTVQLEFYAPWPTFGGKKLSQQWGAIRTDTSHLAPLVRGIGVDADGDFSNLDSVEQTAMQSLMLGQQDFHNKFRWHYSKTEDRLEIEYNDGTTRTPHWYTTWHITADGHVSQQNSPITASNVGPGEGWFKQKHGVDLEFKTVTATSPITVVDNGDSIDIDGSALVTDYSTLGGDKSLITAKANTILPFKGLSAGPNVVLTESGTAIQIESTAQVVEFYGIVVAHDDGSVVYPEVHNFLVNRTDFYVTQQTTGPSNKTIILNSISDPFSSEDYVAIIGDDMEGPLGQADGTAGAPSYTFTDDTTMGMYRKAADDLAFSTGGADVLRLFSDRVYFPKDLQVKADGTAAAPDIYWADNWETGLYQNTPGDDSIAFTTGGTRAGYFDATQNLHVTNSFQSDTVGSQASPNFRLAGGDATGVWVTATEVGFAVKGTQVGYFSQWGDLWVQWRFHNVVAGTNIAPVITGPTAGVGDKTGIWWPSATQMAVCSDGTAGAVFEGDGMTVPGEYKASWGSAAVPSYSFTDNLTTGMYRPSPGNVAFSCAGNVVLSLIDGKTLPNNQVRVNYGTEAAPHYAFSGVDHDLGMGRTGTDTLFFTTQGTKKLEIASGGHLRGVNGGGTSPTYSFLQATNLGMYRYSATQIGWAANNKVCGYTTTGSDGFVATKKFEVGLDGSASDVNFSKKATDTGMNVAATQVSFVVAGQAQARFDWGPIFTLEGTMRTGSGGGDAGTPGYAFGSGQIDVGMYNKDTDVIGFSCGASGEQAYIDALGIHSITDVHVVTEAYGPAWEGVYEVPTKDAVYDKIESVIGGAGEANTASNIGAGAGVWFQKDGVDLEFKSLKAQDSTISVTNDADEIFFSATGNFYSNVIIDGDLTVGETGSAALYVNASAKIVGITNGARMDCFGDLLMRGAKSMIWEGGGDNEFVIDHAYRSRLLISTDLAGESFSLMRDTGYLGLGTYTPQARLDINGDLIVRDDLHVINDIHAGRIEAGTADFYASMSTRWIDFTLGDDSIPSAEGRLFWDEDDGTLAIGLSGGNVTNQIGQETQVRVSNKSGSDIVNGKLVYITGSQGNRPTVDLADNTDANKLYILGMTTEDIDNDGNGYVTIIGQVRGETAQPIDTSGFVEGDRLYLDTAGGWTATHPSGATIGVIVVGTVLRVHATDGVIQMARPDSFTIGNDFDGTMRQSIINKNAGTSSAAGFTAVNDAGHFVTFGTGGSNHSVFTDKPVLYTHGYGDFWQAVDGAKDFVWYTDPTDSHNNSSLKHEVMRLDTGGTLHAAAMEAGTGSFYTSLDVDGYITTWDDPYDETDWNENLTVPTKNAIRDKIEALDLGTPTELSTGTVNATTYGITSDGGVDDVVLVEATTDAAGLLGADKWDEIVANSLKATNVSTTLEAGTVNATSYGITSDGSADDIVLPEADTDVAGLLGADKWDEIVANSLKETNVSTTLEAGTVNATTYGITSDGGADDIVLPEATTDVAGLLGADKWDEIVANSLKATNVPTALSTGTVTATTYGITSDSGVDDVVLVEADTNDAGLLGADKWDEIVANTLKAANAPTELSTGTVTSTTYGITSDGDVDDVVLVEADTDDAGLLGAVKWDEIVANTLKDTNVSTTLEAGTVNATTYGITSDGGADDIVLPEANTTQAGLLGADKWDEIVANSLKDTNVSTTLEAGTVTSTTYAITSDGAADDIVLPEADTDDAGLLGADKWDEIVANTLKAANAPTELSTGTVDATTYGITSDGGVDDVVLVEADTDTAGLLGADKWDEIVASTTHITSDGSDHTFIDQAVTAASSPTFVDIFATNVHASESVDAQTGFFYTALHVGADNNDMWKMYVEPGTKDLTITPTDPTNYGSADQSRINLDGPLHIWKSKTGTTFSGWSSLVLVPEEEYDLSGFLGGEAVIHMGGSATLNASFGVIAVGTLDARTFTNEAPSLSQITIMEARPKLRTDGLGDWACAVPTIFIAQPEIENDTGVVWVDLLNYAINYQSNTSVLASTAGSEVTVPWSIGYKSIAKYGTTDAGAVVTITKHTDMLCAAVTGSSTGTNNLVQRTALEIEADTKWDGQIGIDSDIDAAAGNYFINHTGTAVSEFGGSITATDVLVDDDAYNEGTWQDNLEVPTKNAVRDKIESLGGGPTELSTGTVTATTYGITSDGGVDDVVLVEADTDDAGLLGSDKWDEIVANSLKATNVSTTLEAGTVTATTYGITSDGSADDIVLPEADTDDAGLLGADKWDEIVASTTHISSDGSDHTFIDQDVTTTSSPTFMDAFITNDLRAGHVEAGTGFFYSSLTVGDERADDSIIEFYDEASLAYTMGFDESAAAFKLANGVFDDTNDMLRVTPGEFDFRGNEIQAGSVEAGTGSFYTSLTVHGDVTLTFGDLTMPLDHGGLNRFQILGGSQATTTPAFSFNGNPSTGMGRGGVFDSAYLVSHAQTIAEWGYDEEIDNPGFLKMYRKLLLFDHGSYPGILDLSWDNDQDTGLRSTGEDVMTFVTGGTDAGYFDATQNLHVTNDIFVDDLIVEDTIHAGRVQAGYGDFYTRLTAGTKFWVADDIILMQPNGLTTIAPDGALRLQSVSDDIALVTTDQVSCNAPFRGIYESTAAVPGYSFAADTDTGIFRATANVLGFSTDGTEAGHFDADQSLHVLNDVNASRVEAGHGKFYTTLTAGHITTSQAGSASEPVFTLNNDSSIGLYEDDGAIVFAYDDGWIGELGTTGYLSVNDGIWAGGDIEASGYVSAGTKLIAPQGSEAAPSVYLFGGGFGSVDSGLFTEAADTISITAGGNKGFTLGTTSITTFVQTIARDSGAAGDPSYSFFNQLNSGMFSEGNAVKISQAGSIGLEVFNGYNHMPTILYMDYDYGDVDTPSIAFWNDYQTGIYQAVDGGGAIDFSSIGVHAASIGQAGLHVAKDIFGENDLHVANEMDAQVGFFYTAVHIGGSGGGGAGPGQGDMWKIRTGDQGDRDLYIEPTDTTNLAGNAPVITLDGPLHLWPGKSGETNLNWSNILMTGEYSMKGAFGFDIGQHTQTIATLDCSFAGIMLGIQYEPTVISARGGNQNLTAIGCAPILKSDGLGTWPPPIGNGYVCQMTYEGVEGIAYDAMAAPIVAFRAAHVINMNETESEFTSNGLYSFVSKANFGAAGADSVLTIPENVDVSLQKSVTSGGGTHNLTKRIGMDIEDDTNFDEHVGIESDISERADSYFINHTGGAESQHTGDFNVTGQFHATEVVESPLILGDQGTFYTGVGIGFEAGEDNKMWQLRNPSGTDDLMIEPTIQYPQPSQQPVPQIQLNSSVDLWPGVGDLHTGGTIVMHFSPTVDMTGGAASFQVLHMDQTVNHYATSPQVYGVRDTSEWNSQTNALPSFSTFQLFSSTSAFNSVTNGAHIMTPWIFAASQTFKAIDVTAKLPNSFGFLWSKSFSSGPNFNTSGAAGDLQVERYDGYASQLALANQSVDGVVVVDEFNDFICRPPVTTATGTRSITLRRLLTLEDDTFSDTITGIESAISAGANKKFINHVGTAVSLFGGNVTAPDVLVDDDAYNEGTWQDNLEVPTKNAVRDKIESLGGGPTELSTGTVNATTYGIDSDGAADDVVLVEATTDVAGLLGADKWDEIVANTVHKTSTGADHSYLDQAVTIAGTPTFSTLTVDEEAYDESGWDADSTVPTKNAVRDKFESLPATYADADYVHIGKTAGGSEDIGGANGTTTYIKWDLDIKTVGTDVSHDTSTNNTRIYVNADGRYQIKCNFSANSDGGARTSVGMFHRISAGSISYRGAQNSYIRGGIYNRNARINFNIEVEMTDGQYIEVATWIEDTDSANYTITSEYSACDFIMRKIS